MPKQSAVVWMCSRCKSPLQNVDRNASLDDSESLEFVERRFRCENDNCPAVKDGKTVVVRTREKIYRTHLEPIRKKRKPVDKSSSPNRQSTDRDSDQENSVAIAVGCHRDEPDQQTV